MKRNWNHKTAGCYSLDNCFNLINYYLRRAAFLLLCKDIFLLESQRVSLKLVNDATGIYICSLKANYYALSSSH